MNDNDLKNEVFINIIQKLESQGTFTEVVSSIFDDVKTYLDISNATVLQLDDENDTVTVIVNNSNQNQKFSMVEEPQKEFCFCTEGLCYLTYEHADPKQRAMMDRLHIRTSVTVPIYINQKLAMYVGIFDTDRSLDFGQNELRFVDTISKVIQSLAQKKVTNSSLLSSYEVLRSILNSIGSGIMVCNKCDGTVFFQNEIAAEAEEVRRTIEICIPSYLESIAAGGLVRHSVEHYDAQSGLWFEVKFSDLKWIDGSSVIVCTAMDVTQKKKNQQKIEYQAHNDFLTGLYNRLKCEYDLRHLIRTALQEGTKGALLFIDLDDFKHINDGLGHQYGDVLLQQISAGLQNIPRLRGHCYRMGGDEFVVIVVPEVFEHLQRIIDNIIAMFNKPWYLMGTKYYCTMSMGVSIFPNDSEEVHDIIRLADIAMYESKRAGKNRYEYYDCTKKQDSIQILDIESSMRQAIESQIDEFVVYYQPIIEVNTKKCTTCEALVRWNSKTLGFMNPGSFIPLAERLGLITSIGEYVLEQACKQCRVWNENGYPNFSIHVNLSVVQLLQKDVTDRISRILMRTGVNPHNIILEITESFAIHDMARVLSVMEGIKKLGPRIALDDFGTGYSSLNYMKQLPLNFIKVDKTFIDDILEDEYAQAFIKLIVELSKVMQVQIVVEGVEHIEQFELLKGLNVDYIQGFLFGKPVEVTEFEIHNLPQTKTIE